MAGNADSRREAFESIDASTLTPIVRQVLDDPSAAVTNWEHERLQHRAPRVVSDEQTPEC